MGQNISSHAINGYFESLKAAINLHDLADKLGLKRKGQSGNYHSPQHPDKTPSLSITPNGFGWKDWSSDTGGSCIDLVLYCRPDITTPMDAARTLSEWYGIPAPKNQSTKVDREKKSIPEYIAERCLEQADLAIPYLSSRGIGETVIKAAIQKRTLGWSLWSSEKVPRGEPNHGGPAAAFIVRSLETRHIEAVDMRFENPDLNGGTKTQCHGIKEGAIWTSDPIRLAKAKTVYVVESPINALSVECCPLPPSCAALAIRGTGNADKIDVAFLKGKRVIIALDHADSINERTGQRPGLFAAWKLIDRLVANDISAMLVDMQDWDEGTDVNDVLMNHGADFLWACLRRLESWLISGMPGGGARLSGTRRIFLPEHDNKVYWRYRVREDFTQYVDEFKDNDDGHRSETLGDLCSFRLAGLSRLRVQGHLATINGTPDTQSETVFGISAQTPRHGSLLQREVVDDRQLFNLEWWRSRFGAIFKPAQFQRMLNILERSADLASRDVVNFVGIAWRDGEPAALEGNDCYFIEPAKQCLYHNMAFPRGQHESARQIITAYQATFKENAAAIPFVWALGAHLKALLGFYPHFQMQAEKGSGKSKLLESMQASLAFQVLSGQMLKTDHRRRASVSYTSHPVGWDEFSKLPKSVLSEIDGLLQSTYRFEFTRVGSALTPYLMCAPVMLAGEEVDVTSLQSKICRSSLTAAKQGPIIPHNLPQFPVWQWLQFIAKFKQEEIKGMYAKCFSFCQKNSRTSIEDATGRRMMENYAAIMLSWHLLCKFAEIDTDQGAFIDDLLAEMNSHIAETDGSRLPWVWIMEILLSEIDANRFDHSFCWGHVQVPEGANEAALFLRPSHVMDHISSAPHLRNKFDALPIKTGRIFKKQLETSGVVIDNDAERVIRGCRTAHLSAISLKRLEKLGLYATPRFDL